MSDIESYLHNFGARKSAGSEWIIQCPFCSKSGHLYVNSQVGHGWDGTERPAGRWICFACGTRSRHFAKLMAELDGITFEQARDQIARWKMGTIVWSPPRLEQPPPDPDAPWLPVEFEPVSAVWPKYLTRRGIKREIAIELNLGLCRRHDRCESCRGASCPRDMSHRIILPIECPLGRDFQARAVSVVEDGRERDLVAPRYLSGPTSGQLLFGWNVIEDATDVVLVEGPFDAMALMQAGYASGAMMGKELRDGQFQMLTERRRNYVVMLDPIAKDREAIRSACLAAERLGGLVANNLGAATDPGDVIKPGGPGIDLIHQWIQEAIPPQQALTMAMSMWLKLDRDARR